MVDSGGKPRHGTTAVLARTAVEKKKRERKITAGKCVERTERERAVVIKRTE